MYTVLLTVCRLSDLHRKPPQRTGGAGKGGGEAECGDRTVGKQSPKGERGEEK